MSRLTFENAAFDSDVLRVAEVVGQEHLSRLFQFDIGLGSLQHDLDFTDLINKPALLTMAVGDETIRVQGLVSDFEQRGFSAELALYRAVLVPRLWRLTLNFQSRIFQKMTVQDIINEVLKESGFAPTDVRFDLNVTYPPREFCVQYQETDWNFICRLMEHEGIFFFFEPGPIGEVMVVSDRSSNCTPVALSREIVFHPETDALIDTTDAPVIHELRFREKLGGGTVLLQDYNYRTPTVNLLTSSDLGNQPGVLYEYGEHYKDRKEGERLAKVRFEEITCALREMKGGSNIPAFRPGHTFKLELGRGFRNDLDGEFLLTHVKHIGRQDSGLATAIGQEGASYRNEFSSALARLPYRPPRLTPKPRVPGLMTGVTEGKGDDLPFIDEEGRYRMRLHFDLRDENEAPKTEATHPIRMKQAYSGPNYGWHSPNHEDTEMVVAFVNGDPDRPMALGTAPNPSQKSPSTASNKQQSVYRSKALNELTFDDTAQQENIFMHATKNHTVVVRNSQSISVGADRSKNVGHDENNVIKHDRMTSVNANDELIVGAEQFVAVQKDAILEVLEGNRLVNVKKNYDATAGLGMTLAAESLGVLISGVGAEGIVLDGTGSMGVSIGGKPHFYATGSEKAGLYSKLVSLLADDKVRIEATNEIMLVVGTSSITIKPGGIEITSTGPITVQGLEIKLNS